MKSMTVMLLLSSLVFSGFKCCEKIEEDGKGPLTTILLSYKDKNGNNVEKTYTSDMLVAMHKDSAGFANETVPISTDYMITYSATDPGCIQEMFLEREVGVVPSKGKANWIDTSYTVINYPIDQTCPQRNALDYINVPAHNKKFILYSCKASDYAGHGSFVTIWVCQIPQ